MLPILKSAKTKKIDATLSVDTTLHINGCTYTIDTLEKLPPDLDPRRIATPTNGKVIAFLAAASPLSNFHQCSVKYEDGIVWPNAEAYCQGLKAKHFNDDETFVRLTEKMSAVQCFRLGLNVKDFKADDWYQNAKAKSAMVKVCHAKFTQNPHLRSLLLSFAGTHFIEANSHDKIWGIGLNIF